MSVKASYVDDNLILFPTYLRYFLCLTFQIDLNVLVFTSTCLGIALSVFILFFTVFMAKSSSIISISSCSADSTLTFCAVFNNSFLSNKSRLFQIVIHDYLVRKANYFLRNKLNNRNASYEAKKFKAKKVQLQHT